MTPSPTAPNEAAERLLDLAANRQMPADARLTTLTMGELRAALRTERLRVVEQVRAALPSMMKAALPGAFLQSDDLVLGTEAASRILDAVAGLSGEEPSE